MLAVEVQQMQPPDTHLHADFLSGAVQLAPTTGAQVLASAAGAPGVRRTGTRDGDEVDLGGLRLQALATPGHTDEHLSFLLLDGDPGRGVHRRVVARRLRRPYRPVSERTGPRNSPVPSTAPCGACWRLPAPTAVWPTHGAGSFCSAPPGADRTSTIGRELATNPLLQPPTKTRSWRLLGSLGSYPPYFRRLGEVNRRGPR